MTEEQLIQGRNILNSIRKDESLLDYFRQNAGGVAGKKHVEKLCDLLTSCGNIDVRGGRENLAAFCIEKIKEKLEKEIELNQKSFDDL